MKVDTLKYLLFRNSYCRNGSKAKKNQVNLEYFNSEVNLGDALSPVIFEWMLSKKEIDKNKKINKTKHLMIVGSLIGGSGFFDATIWGSGIRSLGTIYAIDKKKYFQKFDIRAVRGPLTREILLSGGYKCPEVFGDPAIFMPDIYEPKISKVKGRCGVVLHFHSKCEVPDGLYQIDIKTENYKEFIDGLCSCEKIISSSLHGIILAEAYGIPAVFLCKDRDSEMLKYYDWYYSTGRKNVVMAKNIEEALETDPMIIPDLDKMKQDLLCSFPYDIFS